MRSYNAPEGHDHGTSLMHDPSSLAVCESALHRDPRCHTVSSALSTCSCSDRRKKPLSAQTTGALPGKRHHATTRQPHHPDHPGLAVAVVRLAISSSRSTTGDISAVAAPGVATVVARHIVPWPTTDPSGAASAHPADGA